MTRLRGPGRSRPQRLANQQHDLEAAHPHVWSEIVDLHRDNLPAAGIQWAETRQETLLDELRQEIVSSLSSIP